ncbi:MAG: hypothetical protein AAFW83_08965 [Pseudomonadota bacterium]
MIIDNIDLLDLPQGSEQAFVEYDKRLRNVLRQERIRDADDHRDQDGFYAGNREPERYYVSSILAFLDEYELDAFELDDISELPKEEFEEAFTKFFTKINYLITRYALRESREETGTAGTPILIAPQFKDEIMGHLETVRKIVEQEIQDEFKKNAIYEKLANLELEINRDRTTADALFIRMIQFSSVINECGDKIDPLLKKAERIKALIFEGSKRRETLPPPKRKKQLPAPKEEDTSYELDDDIPF